MVIDDARVRIWVPDTPQRPWAPKGVNQAHRPLPLGKDELSGEIDAAGGNRVVIVPPSREGDRNDLALEAARPHPDRLAVMGRLPNIAVKATALACSITGPFPSLHQHVRRVVDAYGPQRVFWGTDPMRLSCPLPPGGDPCHGGTRFSCRRG